MTDLIYDMAWVLFIPMGVILFFMMLGALIFTLSILADSKGWPPNGS
jgi:hypothetical protein